MNQKVCSVCGDLKDFSEFYARSNRKSGIIPACKKCSEAARTARARTKLGLIGVIYDHQVDASKKRKYSLPEYSKAELREWALRQDVFHKLYEDWVASGYEKDLVPSFDRIKNNLPYTFRNLQIMTWYGNSKKAHEDQKNGIDNRRSKGVVGTNILTLETVEFPSQRMAARKLGINQSRISKCCLGKQKTTCGYRWEFKIN